MYFFPPFLHYFFRLESIRGSFFEYLQKTVNISGEVEENGKGKRAGNKFITRNLQIILAAKVPYYTDVEYKAVGIEILN